jgi:hypothetical protein
MEVPPDRHAKDDGQIDDRDAEQERGVSHRGFRSCSRAAALNAHTKYRTSQTPAATKNP